MTLNEDCRQRYIGFGNLSEFYINDRQFIGNETCEFQSIDGENKIVYDFDECGTVDPSVNFQYIEFTGTLYHAAGINVANAILYTFHSNFTYNFTCKVDRTLNVTTGNIVLYGMNKPDW